MALDILDGLVAAATGVGSSVLTYLATRQKNNIDAVQEAQKFWIAESNNIRKELRDRIQELHEENLNMEGRMVQVEKQRDVFRTTLARCNEEKDALTTELVTKDRQLHEAYVKIEELKVLAEISLMGQERASGAASGAAHAVQGAVKEIKDHVTRTVNLPGEGGVLSQEAGNTGKEGA